jgi:xylulokinase
MKRYLLGIDLGTTATKAVLYSADGSVMGEARAEVPIEHPQPGVALQNSEDFYTSAAKASHECLRSGSIDPSEVAGVAFDSQMAGIGTIDEDFLPATHFDSWLDMRCQSYIHELSLKYGDEITSLTGCPPTCNHGPKILWWMHERPDEFRRIAKFVTPACYVAGRVAGLRADEAFIDYTFLHFTALADARAGTWSSRLCQLLGVDTSRLPRIVAPWDVVGEVRPQAAQDFGLAAGTIVAAGCGDTAAGALGAGVVEAGMLLETAGTASVFSCCTDRYAPDRENRALMTMRSVVPGVWNCLAYIAGGGLALPWFRENFCGLNGEPRSKDDYERLLELAGLIPPGCGGLFFSPHLGGRICPAAPEMRGAWVGFSWGHTVGHFFRAILESIGYEYAYYLRILRRLLPGLRLIEARVIGGGAQSAVWNQIKADILCVTYKSLTRPESATWGSALVAGRACALINNLTEAARGSARVSNESFNPDPQVGATYQRAFEHYLCWQERLGKGLRRDV